ncbi:MAG: hypothetical protein R3C19_23415 [Planctomycetaceae bacterium]
MKTLAGELVIVASIAMSIAGCSGESADSELLALRRKFVVETPASEIVSIESVRSELQAGEREWGSEIVLRGRINAGDLSPWEPGKAAFVLTDATGHDDDDDHDPHECPFCSRNIESMIAHVEFRNDAGQVIEIDARSLFDVQEKQLVIVRGNASIDDSGILQLAAKDLYIK